jgi:hypothetical protein
MVHLKKDMVKFPSRAPLFNQRRMPFLFEGVNSSYDEVI